MIRHPLPPCPRVHSSGEISEQIYNGIAEWGAGFAVGGWVETLLLLELINM